MSKLKVVALLITLNSALCNAAPVTINFDTVPTNTTYAPQGLVLASSNGYAVGSCGGGQVGCLGPIGFVGNMTMRFVQPGGASPVAATALSFVMCRSCPNRPSTAALFRLDGTLLTTLSLSANGGVAAHTFSYSAAPVGSIRFDFSTDAIESLTFTPTVASAPVPTVIPTLSFAGTVLMASLLSGACAFLIRKKASAQA